MLRKSKPLLFARWRQRNIKSVFRLFSRFSTGPRVAFDCSQEMTKIRTVSQSNAIGQSKLNYSNTTLDFLPVNLIFFSQAGRDHYVYWLRNTKPGITAGYRRRSFDILIVIDERFSSASPFFRFICWGYFHNILNSVTKKWMFLLTWRAFGLVSIDHLHFCFHPSFLSLITRLANGKISVSL